MKLRRLERNVIYEAIMQTSLDPAEFNLEITGETAVISHDSGSAYAFEYVDPDTDVGAPHYTILARVIDGSTRTFTCTTPINSLIQSIQSWAKEAKLVAQTPDLWAEMQRTRELVVDEQWTAYANTLFTKDERTQIIVELDAIKHRVKEQFDLTHEQIAHIEERLDEAAEASERVGRKDWRLLIYGTIINLAVTDTVTPGVARHMLAMVIQLIAHVFTGTGGPPQILG
jgi:hypothetical protein